MSHVRPLERGDLVAVTRLTSGRSSPPAALQSYFERTLFDDPWADPELPSLVYEEDDGSISGFQGSVTRRAVFDGRPIRIACGVTVVSRTDARSRGVGAMLVRTFLGGPQDVTITDAATEEMRQMWMLLGGSMVHASCTGWVRVFRPWGYTAQRIADRGREASRDAARRIAGAIDPERRAAGPAWSALDAATTRAVSWFSPGAPTTVSEPLAPEALVEHLPLVADSVRLHVAYDEPFARWLFDELRAVRTLRSVRTPGTLVARLVRDQAGRTKGWYVYYLKPRGAAHVLQIAAPEADAGAVIDDLFHHAWTGGATGLVGRVEPRLLAPLGQRRCFFRYVGGALVHCRDPEIQAAIATGDGLLTRLDGEWWMGHYDPELAGRA